MLKSNPKQGQLSMRLPQLPTVPEQSYRHSLATLPELVHKFHNAAWHMRSCVVLADELKSSGIAVGAA